MIRCDYCLMLAAFVDSQIVYRRSYGMIYYCCDCEAWVGVHKGTSRPLGRLANKELRKAKMEAHKYFDNLWQRKMKTGCKKGPARGLGYKWLSEQLGIEISLCHIGMFDVEQCKKVVDVCKPYYK